MVPANAPVIPGVVARFVRHKGKGMTALRELSEVSSPQAIALL